MPQEEEETDELLLLEEDMLDAHPDDLPRRLLADFAVYNAEARWATPSPLQSPALLAPGPACQPC
jgi:hypothetical protein